MNTLTEECATAATTQVPGTRYQWRIGSMFGELTRHIADHLRTLTHPPGQSRDATIEACAIAAATFPRGQQYYWVAPHNFEPLTAEIARRIRYLKTA